MKTANTGIEQLNFISMPEYTYRSVSNTLFYAFQAFGTISKHLHCTNLVTAAGPWFHLGRPTQKDQCF